MPVSVAVATVVLFYLHLFFVADQVLCQPGELGQVDTTESSDLFGSDNGSGEVEPAIDVRKADLLPLIVANDTSGLPCILATLNATLRVSYRVSEDVAHEKYIAVADVQIPEDVQAQAVCGDNITLLVLDWGNSTFRVNLTFTRSADVTGNGTGTWSLSEIAVTYDLSDQNVFPGTSETGTVTAEGQNLALFTTPVGHTHACSRNVKVTVGTNELGVLVIFHDVRIAAFGKRSSEFPPEVTVCPEEDEPSREDDILIPLIVACCLSAIVIIIVIAYVISRKIQTSRNQSQYKQMP